MYSMYTNIVVIPLSLDRPIAQQEEHAAAA